MQFTSDDVVTLVLKIVAIIALVVWILANT